MWLDAHDCSGRYTPPRATLPYINSGDDGSGSERYLRANGTSSHASKKCAKFVVPSTTLAAASESALLLSASKHGASAAARVRRELSGHSSLVSSTSLVLTSEPTYHLLVIPYESTASVECILHVVHASGLKVLRLHAEKMEREALEKLGQTLGSTARLTFTPTTPRGPAKVLAAPMLVQVSPRLTLSCVSVGIQRCYSS